MALSYQCDTVYGLQLLHLSAVYGLKLLAFSYQILYMALSYQLYQPEATRSKVAILYCTILARHLIKLLCCAKNLKTISAKKSNRSYIQLYVYRAYRACTAINGSICTAIYRSSIHSSAYSYIQLHTELCTQSSVYSLYIQSRLQPYTLCTPCTHIAVHRAVHIEPFVGGRFFFHNEPYIQLGVQLYPQSSPGSRQLASFLRTAIYSSPGSAAGFSVYTWFSEYTRLGAGTSWTVNQLCTPRLGAS